MGRVFTWEEVSKGRIPDCDAFNTAMALVGDAVKSDRRILAASFFGSCATGSATPRSDLDLIVVCNDFAHNKVIGDLAVLVQVTDRLCVPLRPQVVAKTLATTPNHDCGGTLLAHIGRLKGCGAIKGDVLSYFAPARSPHEDFINYTSAKLRKLKESFVCWEILSDDERARVLQKCLEAPVQVARKHLDSLGRLGESDGKGVVIIQYLACPQVAPLRKLFSAALRADAWYDRQQKRRPYREHLEEYRRVAEQLRREYGPPVLDYLHTTLVVAGRG